MDHAGPDPVGPLRRFLIAPATGWLFMGTVAALVAWAMGAWTGTGDALLQLCLGALLGMGTVHSQPYAFHQDELTFPLRAWLGFYHAIWLAAVMGLMATFQSPADFTVSALFGGIYGAVMAVRAKPYSERQFAFLGLEETTVFQRGGLQAWLAALWPGLIIAGAAAELYFRHSVPFAIFLIAGALNLAPPYRLVKRDAGRGRIAALLGEARIWVLLALVILASLRLHGTI